MKGWPEGRFASVLLAAISLLALLSADLAAANAANISVDRPWVGKPSVVSIIGEIKRGDGKSFASLVAQLPSVIVGLASPGGNVLAAVQIGEIIRKKDLRRSFRTK